MPFCSKNKRYSSCVGSVYLNHSAHIRPHNFCIYHQQQPRKKEKKKSFEYIARHIQFMAGRNPVECRARPFMRNMRFTFTFRETSDVFCVLCGTEIKTLTIFCNVAFVIVSMPVVYIDNKWPIIMHERNSDSERLLVIASKKETMTAFSML